MQAVVFLILSCALPLFARGGSRGGGGLAHASTANTMTLHEAQRSDTFRMSGPRAMVPRAYGGLLLFLSLLQPSRTDSLGGRERRIAAR